MTLIFGLKKEITTAGAHVLEQPLVHKMAQTEPDVRNQEAQADIALAGAARTELDDSAERTS